jgi:hypothetical protein
MRGGKEAILDTFQSGRYRNFFHYAFGEESMYRWIRMIAALLCFLAAQQEQAVAMPQEDPRTLVLVVSPNLDAKSKDDFVKNFQDVLNTEIKAKDPSRILILEGQKGKRKANFQFDGGAIQKKRMLEKSLGELKSFLKSIEPGDSALDVPAVSAQLPAQKLPKNTTVIFVGNPLYKGITDQDAYFDMREGGYTPRPKLFVVPRDESVFSTIGRSLDGLRFSFVMSDDVKFENTGHEERVLHCWGTYFHLQNANLTQWGSDLAVALEESTRREFKAVLKVDFKPTGDARMFTKVREPGSDEEKDVEKIRPGEDVQNELGEGDPSKVEPMVKSKEVPKDSHGNPAGRKFDLGGNDKIDGKVVLLILGPADLHDEILRSPIEESLRTKIEVKVVSGCPNEKGLEAVLQDASQLWVWANSEPTFSKSHLKVIAKRLQEGMGICLLADNDPWVGGCDEIVKLVDNTASISGNYRGLQILEARTDRKGPGFQKDHPVFHGINFLFEGDTISVPKGERLKTIAWASSGDPLIAEFKSERVKLLVCGGFTAFMKDNWSGKAGTERFIFNTLAYLASN